MIQRAAFALILAVCFSIIFAAPPAPPAGYRWELVFQDDFNGTALDRSKWDPFYTWGGTTEARTHNYDAYAADDHVIVQTGLLRLKVTPKRAQDTHSKTYTTGVIDCGKHFKTKFAYIEGSFKIPEGNPELYNGLWPAFWTCHGKNWPATGEIDIFEFFGKNTEFGQTVWWYDGGNKHEAGTIKDASATFVKTFHTYGVNWQSGVVDFYFNDKKTYSSTHSPQYEHYIMINFGIGGQSWLGSPSKNTFPLYFECDWVKVWKLVQGTSSSPSACFTIDKSSGSAPLTVTANAQCSQASSGATVSSYKWLFGDDGSASGATVSHTYTKTGTFTISMTIEDSNGKSATETKTVTVTAPAVQSPYPGPSPFVLPGKLEAEHFDNGGEGVAYHDGTTGNNWNYYRPGENVDIKDAGTEGPTIGFTSTPGEWTEYTVDIPSGTYSVTIRTATIHAGKKLTVKLGDGPSGSNFVTLGTIPVPVSSSWSVQQTSLSAIFVVANGGTAKVLRLEREGAEGTDFDLNWIDFEKVSSTYISHATVRFATIHSKTSFYDIRGRTVSIAGNNRAGIFIARNQNPRLVIFTRTDK